MSRRPFFFALFPLLAACGGPAAPPAPDLSGQWAGVEDPGYATDCPINEWKVTLSEHDGALSGAGTVGWAAPVAVVLNGARSGASVTITASGGDDFSARFSGTIGSSGEIDGDVRESGVACDNSLTLRR